MAKSKDSLSELTQSVAEEMLAQRAKVQQAAEEMILTAVREDRDFRFDELEFLTSEANYGKQKIAAERRRLGRVVRFQMVAGDSKKRAEVDAKLAAAESVFAKRYPELQAIIDQAVAEQTSITKTRDSLKRCKSEIDAALENLKAVVSPCVAARCSARRAAIKQTLGREYHDALGELSEIEAMLAGPGEDDSAYFTTVRMYDPSLVVRTEGHNRSISYDYSEKWPAFKDACIAELPSRRENVAQLKADFEGELASLESELQQYWN